MRPCHFSKFTIALLSLGLVSFGLAGCGAAVQPNPMPSGYAYHNEAFKAPPGREAPSLGYAFTPEQNAEMLRIWQDVAADALNAFEAQSGLTAQPVYLEAPRAQDAFHRSLDYALREELLARGYSFPGFEGGHLYLRAALYLDENQDARPDAQTCHPQEGWRAYRCQEGLVRSYTLALQGLRAGGVLGAVRRSYALPDYGYEETGVFYRRAPQQNSYNK